MRATKKTRLEYKADIRFRCPEPMADALSAEAARTQKDRSDVAREIFAAGLGVFSRRKVLGRVRRAS